LIEPRREDGRAGYTKPGLSKGDRRETYFILPPEFWTDEWFERLTMPGLAMLLIIAGETSDKEEVWLTNEDAAAWYGLSARSVESGIEDLRARGLLEERVEWIKAPLSAVGSTKRHWYRLTGPFSSLARVALQREAQAELKARTGKQVGTREGKKKSTADGAGRARGKRSTSKKTGKSTSGGLE
jgi:hypothetical protein